MMMMMMMAGLKKNTGTRTKGTTTAGTAWDAGGGRGFCATFLDCVGVWFVWVRRLREKHDGEAPSTRRESFQVARLFAGSGRGG